MKKALSAISGQGYKVLFSDEAYSALGLLLKTENYSSIFILVDKHTEIHCLPVFLKKNLTIAFIGLRLKAYSLRKIRLVSLR